MDPHAEIAKFVRMVVNMASVPSNDQFQQNLAAAKQWLNAIASGNLVVQSKPEAKPEEKKSGETQPVAA